MKQWLKFFVVIVCMFVLAEAFASSERERFKPITDAVVAEYPDKTNIPNPTLTTVSTSELGCQYPAPLRLTIGIAGSQSFAYWFHPKVTLYDVVQQWKSNFDALDKTGYDTTLINGVQSALEELVKVATNIPSQTYWEIIAEGLNPYVWPQALIDEIKKLKTLGIDMPLLAKSTSEIGSMKRFFETSTFLKKYKISGTLTGLGNLSLTQMYYTPATQANFTDAQVGLVDDAISFGYFRSSVHLVLENCPSPTPLTEEEYKTAIDPKILALWESLGEKPNLKEMYLLSGANKCCKISTRQCSEPAVGTCNSCSNFCCLAGTTWCYN